MTTGNPTRRRTRRRVRTRTVLALGAVVAVFIVAVVVVPLLWPPGPRPLFQLPVACGETWRLGTYPGHDDYDVDLFPTEGEAWGRPVLASYSGTVTVAGINGSLGGRTPGNPDGPRGRGGGYWLKIDHGGKWETQYLHLLEPPLVKVGQRVAQGDQIGRVGSTGNSGAPHLHYEQRRGWQKVETYFDGSPSGITHDDTEYTVRRTSNNCVRTVGCGVLTVDGPVPLSEADGVGQGCRKSRPAATPAAHGRRSFRAPRSLPEGSFAR